MIMVCFINISFPQPHTRINKTFDNVSPTVTVYDVLDHAMKVTLPDNSTTQTEYSTDAGSNTLKTLVTDALGNRQAPIPTATLQSREYALI